MTPATNTEHRIPNTEHQTPNTKYRIPKFAVLPAALLTLVLLSGCARERVAVTVGKDGTWTRKTVYIATGPEVSPGGSKAAEVGKYFSLPSGEGWKLTEQKVKDEQRVIAERTLKLDQTIENDIAVRETPKTDLLPPEPDKKLGTVLLRRDDPPAPTRILTSNTATVRQVTPGRYVYTETIHWIGDPPASMHTLDEKQTALVKTALPAQLATDENVKFVAGTFVREFDLALVGPPSPLMHRLPLFMNAPEVFFRLAAKRVGKGLMSALKEKFADQMTAEQRRALTTILIQGIMEDVKANGPSKAGDAQSGENKKNSSGASIFISVRLPGRVVETNGIADAFSGDITWTFYPEAASFGDVTLTATCDTNARSAAH